MKIKIGKYTFFRHGNFIVVSGNGIVSKQPIEYLEQIIEESPRVLYRISRSRNNTHYVPFSPLLSLRLQTFDTQLYYGILQDFLRSYEEEQAENFLNEIKQQLQND